MKPRCSTCRFFSPQSSVSFLDECRRHSPIPRLTFDGRHDEHGLGAWPAVLPDHWCGEFEERVISPQASNAAALARPWKQGTAAGAGTTSMSKSS